MRPSVAPAVSVRLAASLFCLCAAPALAGDAAAIDPIGFSEDGRYFAYEEYGIQDGSGFPYSTVYLIDLVADKWVGLPVRERIDDESARLNTVREAALARAKPMLDKAALALPAELVALNADGETGNDGLELTYGSYGNGLTPPQDLQTLTLTTFASTSTQPCASYGMEEPVKGFALTLASETGDAVEIHRDAAVPASRGCVSDYRIHAVMAPFHWRYDAMPAVAVISVYTVGFEGPDRRFVTVPILP